MKLSEALAQNPPTVAAGAALWTHKGHILGLKLEWLATDSLRVTSGSAYIESLGYAIDAPTAITKSSLVLSASTWYHVYLFNNAGTPDIEIVTTAPTTPYSGTARSKTGDASRRYVGSVRTSGAANLWRFAQQGDAIFYHEPTFLGANPFRIINLGVATTITSVSAQAIVPTTSKSLLVNIMNTSGSSFRIGNSEDGTTDGIIAGLANANIVMHASCGTAQTLTYRLTVAPGSGGLSMDVFGYIFER